MITHCPSCELSFRISDSQLAAAGGLVRCGACLKVFNANEHLGSEQQESPLAAPAGKPPKSLPLGDDGDFFIDDNFDLTLLDQLTSTEPPPRKDPEKKPPRQQEKVPAPGQEPKQQPQQGPEAAPMDGQTDSVLAENSPPETLAQAARPPAPATADTSPQDSPAAQPERPTAPPPPQSPQQQTAPQPAPPLPVATPAHHKPAEQASAADGSSEAAITPVGEAIAAGPRKLATLALAADNFPEHDLAGHSSERTTARSHWLWYPVLVMTLLALPLQYAYFHADILGQDPRWRPTIEILCRAARCTLAPLADLDRITTTNLVVRSHPDHAGALRVDATLLNRATFAQPFPQLTLSFENLEGVVVAARSFAPDEYLGGELKGVALMPSQQPVKLELDILDPGPEAVSYSLLVADPSGQSGR